MNNLLKRLTSKNISIDVVDNQLDIKAPKGAMTSDLLSEIKENKAALLSFISEYKSENGEVQSIPNASKKSNYVLSSSQFRLWFIDQVEENSGAYNMPSAFSLKGEIDVENLEKAFTKLLVRHEILRTNFRVDKASGSPVQVVASSESSNFKLNHFDLTTEHSPSILKSIIEKEAGYHFDLATEELIRVSLVKKSKEEHILILVMHHIISDDWSSSVLMKDLFSLYHSVVSNEDTNIAPLQIQYKDFAEWQQSKLDDKSIQIDKKYWLGQFEEEVPILEIPTYGLRPSIKTYNGNTIRKRLERDVFEGFQNLCKRNTATIFMGLLSVVKILLHIYTKQTDIVIGSPFAGRELPELQNQIGFYVNTVGLRNSIKSQDSFIQLLAQVKKTTLDAYAHQDYPFDELIKNLELEVDKSRSPLFDVILTVDTQDDKLDDFNMLKGLQVEEIPLNDTTSKFDLELVFQLDDEGAGLNLTYNTDIYTEAFISQAANHLEVLLQSVVEHPEAAIETLNYLTEEEETILLETFNDTKVDFEIANKTYIELFTKQVNKHPENIAVEFEDKQMSYQELDKLSNQLAHYLIDNYDVEAGNIVGVKLERSDWLIVSFLAVMKAGAAYLPIDINYPEERIAFIESDSDCKVIIDPSIVTDFKNIENQLDTLPAVDLTSSDLAYVIYTSGSTGTPKGTLIQHKSLLNLCFWHRNEYEVSDSSRGTLYSGIAFDASIWEMAPYLLFGATLLPINDESVRLNIDELCLFLSSKNTTHSFLPTVISHGLMNKNKELTNIKILTGGDALNYTKASKFELYNNYGPTENTVVASSFDTTIPYISSSIPIGKPISNTQLYILDEHLKLLPIGVPGRLYISGDSLAKGYLNLPELTADKFIDNPFNKGSRMYDSGDMAKWLPDGNIVFLGRKDHQVQLRGFRIELGEIENAILKYSEDIRHAVVYMKESERKKSLVSFFSADTDIDIAALKTFLKEYLPSYMVPKYFMSLEEIPQTQNGKIDKKKLLAMTLPEKKTIDYVEPNTDTEKHLVEIWKKVLGVGKVGIYDNFFELGGYSLQVTRMLFDINDFFDVQLEMKEVFSATNIHELAKIVDNELLFQAGISTDSNPKTDNTKKTDVWEI